MECVLILPIVLTLLACIWQVNQLKTLKSDFEAAASILLGEIAQEMYQLSPSDALGAMLVPNKHYEQQKAFIEHWKRKGIIVHSVEIKQQQWISRRMALEIAYQLPRLTVAQGGIPRNQGPLLRFQACAYIRAPFEDREQWLAVGSLVEDIKLLDDAIAGLNKLQSIWQTWVQQSGGN